MDCQRHTRFPHQYRAMFVLHCQVLADTRVHATHSQRRGEAEAEAEAEAEGSPARRRRRGRAAAKADEDDDAAVYLSVCCEECGTEVGVAEDGGDGVYHFFNVLDTSDS